MKIVAGQLNYTVGDFKGNSEKIEKLSRYSSDVKADLTVTSELSIWGYPPQDLTLYPGLVNRSWERIDALAHEVKNNPPLLIGAVEASKHLYTPSFRNVAVLLMNGTSRIVCSKKYLPYYDVFDENRYFSPGEGPSQIEINGKKVIVSICEDLWKSLDIYSDKKVEMFDNDFDFPESDIIINMSASPFHLGKPHQRKELLKGYSAQYQKHVLFVNQVGSNDSIIFDGNSQVITYPELSVEKFPSFCEHSAVKDFSQPPINNFSSKTEKNIEESNSTETNNPRSWENIESTRQALVLGIKDYVHKNGFKNVLLGLSGGIDSAVTAYLAVEALGAENVQGIIMPSEFNSSKSAQDALELAEKLKMKTSSIDIDPLKNQFLSSLEELFQSKETGVAEENLQSRIRGTLLMALSNKHGSLLLTTGNKSEMAVGYCTIYGDMNGALGVIADVWKTDVYKLAKHINEKEEIIPDSIITKEPSAELRHDQKDQDSLPEYDVLDGILKMLVEEFKTPQEVVEEGFDENTVKYIIRLLSVSEFKRDQAALILKVSPRCFTLGWRHPITAKIFQD